MIENQDAFWACIFQPMDEQAVIMACRMIKCLG